MDLRLALRTYLKGFTVERLTSDTKACRVLAAAGSPSY
jgi:hypothetical protein